MKKLPFPKDGEGFQDLGPFVFTGNFIECIEREYTLFRKLHNDRSIQISFNMKYHLKKPKYTYFYPGHFLLSDNANMLSEKELISASLDAVGRCIEKFQVPGFFEALDCDISYRVGWIEKGNTQMDDKVVGRWHTDGGTYIMVWSNTTPTEFLVGDSVESPRPGRICIAHSGQRHRSPMLGKDEFRHWFRVALSPRKEFLVEPSAVMQQR